MATVKTKGQFLAIIKIIKEKKIRFNTQEDDPHLFISKNKSNKTNPTILFPPKIFKSYNSRIPTGNIMNYEN
jgi:hypothetical protein